MSRLSQDNTYITEEHDDGFSSLGVSTEIKENKVVIWDFDSMLHHCLYSGKNELGERNPEYTEADLEFLQGKLTEMTLKVLNNIEKYYNIIACYIFIKGNKTFRKELYPEYKAHRPPAHPLLSKLYDYAKVAHQAIESGDMEAEDMVYQVSKKIDNNGIIVYVDHDLLEIPSLFYNYQKNRWHRVTEEGALWNEYNKYVKGESGDNVNLCKGVGQKFFEKTFKKGMSVEEYDKSLFTCFMKAYKNDEKLALENLLLTKRLLGLKYARI